MKIEDVQRITVIMRGYDYDKVRVVAKAMSMSNIRSMEITTNSPNAFETAKKIAEEFPEIFVGIGTVMNESHVNNAIEIGAKFILTPVMLDGDLIQKCKDNGILTVVSALTPSEVNKVNLNGADIIKIFPASNLGSDYAKALKGPLGNKIKFMAVGGVNIDNVSEFLGNGYDYVGIGSSMFSKEDIEQENIDNLVKALNNFERRI